MYDDKAYYCLPNTIDPHELVYRVCHFVGDLMNIMLTVNMLNIIIEQREFSTNKNIKSESNLKLLI